MAKKRSKPPPRPKPARTAPASSTDAGGTWSRGTGKDMGLVRALHNRAMAAHGYRPRGSR